MTKLINLLERIADQKGVKYLTNLLDKNGFNPDLIYFLSPTFAETQNIENEYVEELIELLEESLEELPF